MSVAYDVYGQSGHGLEWELIARSYSIETSHCVNVVHVENGHGREWKWELIARSYSIEMSHCVGCVFYGAYEPQTDEWVGLEWVLVGL